MRHEVGFETCHIPAGQLSDQHRAETRDDAANRQPVRGGGGFGYEL
jgi:hypothetical protein